VLPGVAIKMVAHRSGGCQVEIDGRTLTLPRELTQGVYIQWLTATKP